MENIKEYIFTQEELESILRDLTSIKDMLEFINQKDGPIMRRVTSAIKQLRNDEVLKNMMKQ